MLPFYINGKPEIIFKMDILLKFKAIFYQDTQFEFKCILSFYFLNFQACGTQLTFILYQFCLNPEIIIFFCSFLIDEFFCVWFVG